MLAHLGKMLTFALSPLGALLLVLLVAVCLPVRHLRKGLFAALVLLLGFALPQVAGRLMGGLEAQARALAAAGPAPVARLPGAPPVLAIVLGGAVGAAVPGVRAQPDMLDSSDRVWHAARLYRQGVVSHVFVSAGGFLPVPPEMTEAHAIGLLLQDLGVPPEAIIQESVSATTTENALQTRQWVQQNPAFQPATHWLVTSAFHMPRALQQFERAGLAVRAAPTDFRVVQAHCEPWFYCFPSAGSLATSSLAVKEYLGLLALRWM